MKIKSILFNFESILIIFWISCLFSINSKISDIYNENNSLLNFTIIFLRIINPIIVFFVLIFFLKIKKISLFILSYLIYGTWTLIVYNPDTDYPIENLERYHLIFSMITILLIIHIMENSKFKNIDIKILYSSIIFVGLISLYFSFFLLLELFQDRNVFYLYHSSTLITEGTNLLQVNPRITGISRMLGLVLLFIFSLYICNSKNKFIYNFIFLLIIFLISFLIYGMQSKGSYISILLLIFYYIIFFKDKIKKKLFMIFIILIIPILSFETIIKIKFNTINKEANDKIIINRFLSDNSIIINGEEIKDYTTGRFEIWKRAFKIIVDENIIFGKGPQADRLILKSENFDPKKPRHFYDSNSSNGLIYSYLCAGIIGLLFILSIYLLIIYEIYKSIFINKAFIYKNSYSIFSILTLSFLTTRTIYENGFTLFGVDFIFTIISYFILKRLNGKKINNKLY